MSRVCGILRLAFELSHPVRCAARRLAVPQAEALRAAPSAFGCAPRGRPVPPRFCGAGRHWSPPAALTNLHGLSGLNRTRPLAGLGDRAPAGVSVAAPEGGRAAPPPGGRGEPHPPPSRGGGCCPPSRPLPLSLERAVGTSWTLFRCHSPCHTAPQLTQAHVTFPGQLTGNLPPTLPPSPSWSRAPGGTTGAPLGPLSCPPLGAFLGRTQQPRPSAQDPPSPARDRVVACCPCVGWSPSAGPWARVPLRTVAQRGRLAAGGAEVHQSGGPGSDAEGGASRHARPPLAPRPTPGAAGGSAAGQPMGDQEVSPTPGARPAVRTSLTFPLEIPPQPGRWLGVAALSCTPEGCGFDSHQGPGRGCRLGPRRGVCRRQNPHFSLTLMFSPPPCLPPSL